MPRISFKTFVPWVVVALLLAALAFHVTPARAAAASTSAAIDEAVAQLGSADYAARERAMRVIWSAGQSAEPALKRAIADPRTNPETVIRARGLLQKIHLGLGPNASPELVKLVTQYTQGDAAERLEAARELLKGGEATAGPLVRLWAREKDANVRQQVAEGLAVRARLYAQYLLLDGERQTAESLLLAGSARNTAAARDWGAYLLVEGKLTRALRDGADAADAPTTRLGWMALFAGDLARAERVAGSHHDDALLAAVRWAKGDWAALAERHDRLAAGAPDALNDLTLAAAFHRLAGEEKELHGVLDRLAAYARSHAGATFICSEPFMLSGRVSQGIELMKDENLVGAVELLANQLRFDEAFALLDRSLAPLAADPPVPVSRYTQAAFWYARVGEDEKAAALCESALRAANLAAVDGTDDQGWAVGAVARIEVMMGRRDRAAERCLDAVARGRPDSLVGALFPPAKMSQVRLAWRGFRNLAPQDVPRVTLGKVDRLLAGRSPADELARWAEKAKQVALAGSDYPAQASMARAIADVLLAYGKDADALALYDALELAPAGAVADARGGSMVAGGLMILADRAAAAGRWRDAAELYGRARAALGEHVRHDVVPLYLQGRALTKAGRADEGRRLIEQARLVPLADLATRSALALALRQRKLREEAAAESAVVVPLSDHTILEASDGLRGAATDAADRGDYAKALDLLRRSNVALYCQEASFRQPTSYLALARLGEDWRARAMLKAGDAPGAAKVLTAAADLYPMESDWLIAWVLDLDKSNHKPEADALFAHQLDTYQKVCDRYPNAADLRNALAWTAARCGRDLDAALDHAKKAVALRPGRTAYLDTLAEVHFRRGEKAQAVEQIRKAIDLEPTDAYLRAQLKRFESPVPAEWKGPNELGTPEMDDEN